MTYQPVTYKYTSTKEYHDSFPCAYRQWRADSHCNLIHGYSFSIKVYFGTDNLDVRNWAADYGGLKELKELDLGRKSCLGGLIFIAVIVSSIIYSCVNGIITVIT